MIAALGIGSAYAIAGGRLRGHARRHVDAPAAPPAPTDTEHPPILRSIKEGLTFVRGNSALMGSFAIDLVAMTFGMPRALFAVLALTVYDAGASGTGLLYAVGLGRARRSPR